MPHVARKKQVTQNTPSGHQGKLSLRIRLFSQISKLKHGTHASSAMSSLGTLDPPVPPQQKKSTLELLHPKLKTTSEKPSIPPKRSQKDPKTSQYVCYGSYVSNGQVLQALISPSPTSRRVRPGPPSARVSGLGRTKESKKNGGAELLTELN